MNKSLVVVSCITPREIVVDNEGLPVISKEDQANDSLDDFNHPRFRRALILQALERNYSDQVSFCVPPEPAGNLNGYHSVHSKALVNFLSSAWKRWDELGPDGQDPSGVLVQTLGNSKSPALVPTNTSLPRDPYQRPSKHVIGQMGYFCTDHCTPVFSSLLDELKMDAAIVEMAVSKALEGNVVYALPTHPGHHSAHDSFGGYCYLNHAARAARLLQSKLDGAKVAILDVDYHCGNGTASIFYENPSSVLVVSIHCDPDWDYPFHSGFADETGAGEAVGATLHLPLLPGTRWLGGYQDALTTAVNRIVDDFGAQAVVISLGLDTHEDDPCTIRRAGFNLSGQDYLQMGQLIGKRLSSIPTVFVQEGGYRMDKVGKAAADVVVGFSSAS